MKMLACAYREAFGLFAVWEVFFDAMRSCLTISREAVFVIASLLWICASPALALVEVAFPGALDRMLFRLAR